MKRKYVGVLAASGFLAALTVMACEGNDPMFTNVAEDASDEFTSSSGSSGSSGASSGSSGSSGASGGPEAGMDAGQDALAAFDPSKAAIVFITDGEFDGDFGGIPQADQYCQQAAVNQSLPGAALPNSYLAWMAGMSDKALTPASRFKHTAGGYKRVDNAVIALSWDDLTDGTIANPINVTEMGTAISSDFVAWTNVAAKAGQSDGATDCNEWNGTPGAVVTGMFGTASATDSTWTSSATLSPTNAACSAAHRIYCFQQID